VAGGRVPDALWVDNSLLEAAAAGVPMLMWPLVFN